jgi:hypothetical protein
MESGGSADNDGMSSHLEVLVKHISCEECRQPWLDPAQRWRMYLTDDVPAVPVAYCHECAAREFDDD